jgi:hypothetical protein
VKGEPGLAIVKSWWDRLLSGEAAYPARHEPIAEIGQSELVSKFPTTGAVGVNPGKDYVLVVYPQDRSLVVTIQGVVLNEVSKTITQPYGIVSLEWTVGGARFTRNLMLDDTVQTFLVTAREIRVFTVITAANVGTVDQSDLQVNIAVAEARGGFAERINQFWNSQGLLLVPVQPGLDATITTLSVYIEPGSDPLWLLLFRHSTAPVANQLPSRTYGNGTTSFGPVNVRISQNQNWWWCLSKDPTKLVFPTGTDAGTVFYEYEQ